MILNKIINIIKYEKVLIKLLDALDITPSEFPAHLPTNQKIRKEK